MRTPEEIREQFLDAPSREEARKVLDGITEEEMPAWLEATFTVESK